ncbi:putative primase/helicase protein [Vibrio phage vB_VpP_HA7]|uniref:Primase/helicase protein n=1 Tax=Vibrio phage vB_VpP_HA5 TaxID=2980504 RepID=A0A977LIT9_9CAUD|nr:primase protein [Vibrio phage vB_VpaP_AL-1]UXF57388.1 primase/helicase protein [Vibrio phage vB_VpP_HA5]UXF57435.1 putative primase/helicase protein [Vibrio phage vB_VpP_HA7]
MDAPWLRACKRLAIGQTRRFRCCGATAAAILYNNPQSWEMWCNRCKQVTKEPKKYVRLDATVHERSMQPVPTDALCISQTSAEIQHFVFSYLTSKGISPNMLEDVCRLEWSESKGRIIFRFENVVLGRSISPNVTPKWVQYGSNFQTLVNLKPDCTQPSLVVLTEDTLSAIKVQYVANLFFKGRVLVVSTLGTTISLTVRALLASLMEQTGSKPNVLCWYDGDKAGVDGARKAQKVLRPFANVHPLTIDGKDPKDCEPTQIKEVLWTQLS